MNIAVVTAITGDRDELLPQTGYAGVQYIAFLDEPEYTHPWEVRRACTKFVNPAMNAKIHKMLTHKYVDTPYIVWMDGNRGLKKDPHELIDIMGDNDFAFFEHYSRRCVYKEIKTCLRVGRGNPEDLVEQGKVYEGKGIPVKMGLYECSAFIRKNNDNANTMFEKWWAEVCRYSNRDQVSFPVVFKNQNISIIPGKLFYGDNDYFTYNKHL